MSRRTLGLVFGALVLTLLISGYWVYAWYNSKVAYTCITPENGAKISLDMALADAEEILGGPARDESSGPLEAAEREALAKEGQTDLEAVARHVQRLGTDKNNTKLWVSDRAIILLHFNTDGTVSPGVCLPVRRVDSGWFEWIRRQIGF